MVLVWAWLGSVEAGFVGMDARVSASEYCKETMEVAKG